VLQTHLYLTKLSFSSLSLSFINIVKTIKHLLNMV
jgi:hypothetical protein